MNSFVKVFYLFVEPSTNQEEDRETAAEIFESLLLLLIDMLNRKQVKIAHIVQRIELKRFLKILNGFLILVELSQEDSPIGIKKRVSRELTD